MEFIDKSDIMKGIGPDTTADLLEKAMGHKYYKREGVPGNYKYYYTEAEYKQAKGEPKDSKSKEIIEKDGKIKVEDFKVGDIISFKDGEEWVVVPTSKISSHNNPSIKSGEIMIKPHNKLAKDKNISLPISVSMEFLSKELEGVAKKGEGKKGVSENEIKVGDKIKGSSGVTKDKVGVVTSINGDMAQVDFGRGDKYGITLRRIKEGEFTKEELEDKGKKTEAKQSSPKSFDAIRQWAGDHLKDEYIQSIVDALDEAGITNSDLRTKKVSNREADNREVDKKVMELRGEIREGLEHEDMRNSDIKDVLWGMVMASRDEHKFFD